MTSILNFEVSKLSIWKHTTSCDKGLFSFIIISQLRQPIELKGMLCYAYMLRYTKWGDWSMTNYQECPMFLIGHRSCMRIRKEKTPLMQKFVFFQMPNKRLQAWSLFFYLSEKFLSQKLRYFRGSRFSQCYTINGSPLLVTK